MPAWLACFARETVLSRDMIGKAGVLAGHVVHDADARTLSMKTAPMTAPQAGNVLEGHTHE